MDLREKSRKKAKFILEKMYDSTLSLKWKDTDTNVILRGNYPAQYYAPEYLEIHTLENMLHAFVNVVLDKNEQLDDIVVDLASGENHGVRYPRSVIFKLQDKSKLIHKGSFHGSGKDGEYKCFDKIGSTLELDITDADHTYVTKSHIIGSMLFTKYKFDGAEEGLIRKSNKYEAVHVEDPRAFFMLDELRQNGFSGLLHNVYNIDRNLIYYYTDTNAMMGMLYSVMGMVDNSTEHMKELKENAENKGIYCGKHEYFDKPIHAAGEMYDNALANLAQAMNGEDISEFMDRVEAQNPKGLPITDLIYADANDISEWSREHPRYDVKGTVAYAILLNYMGDKKGAIERLEALEDYKGMTKRRGNVLAPLENFNKHLWIESEPYLWLSLAYADISREKSFFETNYINADLVNLPE